MAFKRACAPLLKEASRAYRIGKTRNRGREEHVKERNYDARKDWRVPLSGVFLA